MFRIWLARNQRAEREGAPVSEKTPVTPPHKKLIVPMDPSITIETAGALDGRLVACDGAGKDLVLIAIDPTGWPVFFECSDCEKGFQQADAGSNVLPLNDGVTVFYRSAP